MSASNVLRHDKIEASREVNPLFTMALESIETQYQGRSVSVATKNEYDKINQLIEAKIDELQQPYAKSMEGKAKEAISNLRLIQRSLQLRHNQHVDDSALPAARIAEIYLAIAGTPLPAHENRLEEAVSFIWKACGIAVLKESPEDIRGRLIKGTKVRFYQEDMWTALKMEPFVRALDAIRAAKIKKPEDKSLAFKQKEQTFRFAANIIKAGKELLDSLALNKLVQSKFQEFTDVFFQFKTARESRPDDSFYNSINEQVGAFYTRMTGKLKLYEDIKKYRAKSKKELSKEAAAKLNGKIQTLLENVKNVEDTFSEGMTAQLEEIAKDVEKKL